MGSVTDTVKVTLDRSSVAMGDDTESHRVFWIFPESATVDDLLVEICSHYVPGIAGPAGWCVDVNTDDQVCRRDLGVIYEREDLRQEANICRLVTGRITLGDLAQRAKIPDLDIYVRHMTSDKGRPLTISEVTSGPTYTGAQPTKLESEAAADADARIDWVFVRELERRAAAVTAARRDWIRNNILSATTPPPGTDDFIARNFHFLTDLHCPASMHVATQLLTTDEAELENLDAIVDLDEQLKFSAHDIARLDRVRQLRDLQYQLRVRRYYTNALGEVQYRAAIESVHAELSARGELPVPM